MDGWMTDIFNTQGSVDNLYQNKYFQAQIDLVSLYDWDDLFVIF